VMARAAMVTGLLLRKRLCYTMTTSTTTIGVLSLKIETTKKGILGIVTETTEMMNKRKEETMILINWTMFFWLKVGCIHWCTNPPNITDIK